MKFMAGENGKNPEKKTYPDSVSSTKKPIWSDRDANPVVGGGRLTACAKEVPSNNILKFYRGKRKPNSAFHATKLCVRK